MVGAQDILVVSPESCWPTVNGGRVRTAALALELAQDWRVALVAPGNGQEVSAPLPVIWVSGPTSASVRERLSPRPALGSAFLGLPAREQLGDAIAATSAKAIVYSHSYLAAMGLDFRNIKVIVDFPNIEAQRQASLARVGQVRNRLSALLESYKAKAWERCVASAADLAIAVSESDAELLRKRSDNVVVVENAVDDFPDLGPSPPDGPAVMIGSFGYAPNLAGAEDLLRRVWPEVIRANPRARLIVAGTESKQRLGWADGQNGVAVTGEVASVLPLLAGAAIVLAPVTTGGGTQLKVVQALAAKRVVVATSYSAMSIPRAQLAGCAVASDWREFADAIVELMLELPNRRIKESVLRHTASTSWRKAAEPLRREVARVIEARSGSKSA